MQVPEDHANPEGRLITFPVVVFRSNNPSSNKAPLLHLGAGGPGASMFLDQAYVVSEIWQSYDDMSIQIDRDLFVIDPRGTGLSEPLLTCDRFVDNELVRFRSNLSVEQELHEVDKDYRYCIEQFLADGLNLSTYNSVSIAADIEVMRKAARVDQWVLFGVSYGSIYAQVLAARYPDSVESMVLDSATFPQIKWHDNYLEKTLAPFQKLFDYCESDPDCSEPDDLIEQRIWGLYTKLTEDPIQAELDHPYDQGTIAFLLNGERFIAALLQGIYGVEIFRELPQIIDDLESASYERFKPYLNLYVDYMLDRHYGDISASAHYCYEDKPFIDFNLIDRQIEKLPAGYIRDSARRALEAPDFCDQMQIHPRASDVMNIIQIEVPTLFLHGEIDTVTPLSDVESNRSLFKNHELVTFKLSHSILSGTECAEKLAAKFIENRYLKDVDIVCDRTMAQFR